MRMSLPSCYCPEQVKVKERAPKVCNASKSERCNAAIWALQCTQHVQYTSSLKSVACRPMCVHTSTEPVNVYTIHSIHCSIKYCLLGMGFNGKTC